MSLLQIDRGLSANPPTAQKSQPETSVKAKPDEKNSEGNKTENYKTAKPADGKSGKPEEKKINERASGTFQVGVWVLVSVLMLVFKWNGAKWGDANFWSNFEFLHSWQYLTFSFCCLLSCVYSAATHTSQLKFTNVVMYIAMAVIVFVIFFGKKPGDAVNQSASPSAYAAPVVNRETIDYDDSGPNHLGIGPHHFTFADSGEQQGPYRDKKEVSGSKFFMSDPEKRLKIVYNDGDTLKCWLPNQHKATRGKWFVMIALAPMDVEKDND